MLQISFFVFLHMPTLFTNKVLINTNQLDKR